MSTELTFREGIQLSEVLLSAIPSRSAMEQLLFERFGQTAPASPPDSDYGSVLTQLILWVEEQGTTSQLIAAARTANPGNQSLRDFAQRYNQQHPADLGVVLPRRVLTTAMRNQLVNVLLLLPVTNTLQGRNSYLVGNSSALNRDEIPRVDLTLILDQLDGLGRLSSGEWPLILFIDNALNFAEGLLDVSNVLQTIRQQLQSAYDAQGQG